MEIVERGQQQIGAGGVTQYVDAVLLRHGHGSDRFNLPKSRLPRVALRPEQARIAMQETRTKTSLVTWSSKHRHAVMSMCVSMCVPMPVCLCCCPESGSCGGGQDTTSPKDGNQRGRPSHSGGDRTHAPALSWLLP